MDAHQITRLTDMRNAYANHGDPATCDIADILTTALSELSQLGEADRRAGAATRQLAAANAELQDLRKVAEWVKGLKARVGLAPNAFLEELEERLLSQPSARPVQVKPSGGFEEDMGDFPAYEEAPAVDDATMREFDAPPSAPAPHAHAQPAAVQPARVPPAAPAVAAQEPRPSVGAVGARMVTGNEPVQF